MFRLGLVIAVAILAVDQISKYLLIGVMQENRFQPIEITPFFNLVMVWNRGVSFGLFASDLEAMRWVLTVLAIGVSIGLLIWLYRAANRSLAIGLGLVIGGAIGNAVDRVVYGAVADFFDFHLAGVGHWPAFNIADSAIVVGVGFLLIDSLFADARSHK